MEVSPPTRTCDLCKKEVAEVNFSLHEVHCRRFLCLCPDCDEPVPRETLTQHREEEHAMVRCCKCNKKMEKRHLSYHEVEECLKRMQGCEFCQLPLPFEELQKHSVVCGSRTELCINCGCYVKLMEWQTHDQTCSGSSDTRASVSTATAGVTCTGSSRSIPAENLDQNELKSIPKSEINKVDSRISTTPQIGANKTSNRLSNRARDLPQCNGKDPDELSSCPHCHLLLPLFTLQWHEVKCRRHVWRTNKF